MLRVARSRPGAERVSWIKAEGQTLRLPLRFDFIYMTGHAFQALLTDDDAIAVLRTAHDHLTDDGRFAFESRNPARKPWLSWTPDRRRAVTTTDHGQVEEFFDTAAIPTQGSDRPPFIGLPIPAGHQKQPRRRFASIRPISPGC
jgi:hypothetical protein